MRMVRNRAVRIPPIIAHINHTRAPVEPAGSPAPFSIPCTKPNTGTIANISRIAIGADIVNNTGIVHRHVDIFRAGRLNDNNRIGGTDRHLFVRLQVAVFVGLVTQALNSIHDTILLGRDSIPQLVGPRGVFGHHIKNRRERNQCLNARIVSQIGIFNRLGQSLALFIFMGLGKSIRRRNLVTISRSRKHMDQQRVRIKGYCRDKRIQFGRRIIGLAKGKSRKQQKQGERLPNPPGNKTRLQGVFNHGNLLHHKIHQLDVPDHRSVPKKAFFCKKSQPKRNYNNILQHVNLN